MAATRPPAERKTFRPVSLRPLVVLLPIDKAVSQPANLSSPALFSIEARFFLSPWLLRFVIHAIYCC